MKNINLIYRHIFLQKAMTKAKPLMTCMVIMMCLGFSKTGNAQITLTGTAPGSTGNDACATAAAIEGILPKADDVTDIQSNYSPDACGISVVATFTGSETFNAQDNCTGWEISREFTVQSLDAGGIPCGPSLQVFVDHSGSDITPPAGMITLTPVTGIDDCSANAVNAVQTASSVMSEIAVIQVAFTDVCSGIPTVTLDPTTNVLDVGSDNCAWSVTRTYEVADACGNVVVGGVSVTHSGGDMTAPVLKAGGALPAGLTGVNACMNFPDATAALNAQRTQAAELALIIAEYEDACGGILTGVIRSQGFSGGDDCSWTFRRRYRVVDECLNETFNINIDHSGGDMTPPALMMGATTPAGTTGTNSCFGSATTSIRTQAAEEALILAAYSDNCGTAITAAATEELTGNQCNWTVTRTWTITDACTNPTMIDIVHRGGDMTGPTANINAIGPLNVDADCKITINASDLNNANTDACTTTVIVGISKTGMPGDGGTRTAPISSVSYSKGTDFNFTTGCAPTVPAFLHVIDQCDNETISTMVNVTVTDNTDPTAVTKTPPTYIVSCDQTVNVSDIENGSSDNCQFVTGISTTGAALAGGTFLAPITSVNLVNGVDYDLAVACDANDDVYLHVIDQCGNETISPAVELSFRAANNLSFPAYTDIMETIVSSDCNQNVVIDMPVVAGGCGGPITSSISVPMGVVVNQLGTQWLIDFPVGTTTVGVTAMDNCGNMTPTDEFDVTIIDGTLPVANNCPPAQSVDAGAMCNASVTWVNPTASDNCGVANLGVTFSEHSSSVRCTTAPMGLPSAIPTVAGGATLTATFETGVTEILFTVTDVNGLSNTCSTLITVNDVTAPTVANSAADQTLTTNAGATCPVTGEPLRNSGLPVGNGAFIPFGMPFNVAGQPFNAPVATDFTDNCDIVPIGVISAVVTPGAANDACTTTYTITWTLTDCGGNTVDDVQVFTIIDNTVPVLSGTLPTPASINDCLPNQATADGYFDMAAVEAAYSDVCGTIAAQDVVNTIDPASDNCSWTVTHTFNINDGCGNLTAGSYTTKGGDITAPTGTNNLTDAGPINACLTDAITATEATITKASEIATLQADYTDNCGVAVIASLVSEAVVQPGSSDCSWSVLRTYMVVDECGNAAAGPITVTHTGGDVTPPIGTSTLTNAGPINACLADALTATETAAPTAGEITTLQSNYSDNCGAAVIATQTNEVIDAGSTDCSWSVTRTYSVQDACGNFAVGPITVTHTGGITTGPTIVDAQPDQNLFTTTTDCNQDVFIQQSATMNACGGSAVLSITSDNPNVNFGNLGSQWNADFPVGVTTVTITATDPCGNTTTDEVIVTVTDNIAPVLVGTCPASASLNTALGTCAATHSWNNPGFDDNCLLSQLDITFTSDPADPTTGPMPADKTYTFPQSQGGQMETESFPEGTTIATFTLTDDSNNSVVLCTFSVTVTDNEPPMAMCQDVIVVLDAAGAASITVADINNGSTDNCALGLLSLSETAFSCTDVGPNTVTLSVSQLNTPVLTSTCTAVVTVEDNEAPVAICPAIPDVVIDAMGIGSLPADAAAGGLSTDNCGTNIVESSPVTALGCADVGAQSVTLTVTDGTNTVTAACAYNVVDNMAPIAVCQDVTIVLDATGNTSTTAAAVNNGSSDNCSIASMVLSQTAFDCTEVGANTVTLTLSDGANTSSCNAIVTVADNQAPVAVCPTVIPSVTITTTNGTVTLPANALADGNSTDNCGVNLIETSLATTFDCSNVLVNPMVTLSAYDGTNTTTIDCEVNVVSGGALVFTSALPGDQTLNATVTDCDQDVFIPIPTSSGSSCSGNIVTAISAPGNINFGNLGTQWNANFPVGVTHVTITATDALGVVITHTLTITIIDNTPPVISSGCPANIVIPAADICNSTASFNLPNATDACGIAGIDVTYSGNSILPANITNQSSGTTITEDLAIGITTVTITAYDINGLTATCSFTVESPCTTVANPCIDNRYVSTADIVANGTSALYKANIRTYSDAVIPSGFDIDYFGGTEVELLPGFETIIGAVFLADIAPCNSLPLNGPITPESKRLLHSAIKELKETKESKDMLDDQNIEIRK